MNAESVHIVAASIYRTGIEVPVLTAEEKCSIMKAMDSYAGLGWWARVRLSFRAWRKRVGKR